MKLLISLFFVSSLAVASPLALDCKNVVPAGFPLHFEKCPSQQLLYNLSFEWNGETGAITAGSSQRKIIERREWSEDGAHVIRFSTVPYTHGIIHFYQVEKDGAAKYYAEDGFPTLCGGKFYATIFELTCK